MNKIKILVTLRPVPPMADVLMAQVKDATTAARKRAEELL